MDTDKYDYIMTYSFPCQDLSLAGKLAGLKKGSGTRSGMLWEVERILEELEEKPQILLMENVPAILNVKNKEDFQNWMLKLEELGYSNYVDVLNAKDYGVPQNRERCFMISILGDYNYTFPKKEKLKLRLKDLLEENVDEKYFLSDKIINFFKENSINNEQKGNGFRFTPITRQKSKIAKCITTRNGSRMDDNFIIEDLCHKALRETLQMNEVDEFSYIDAYNRTIKNDGITKTITTRTNPSNNTFICVPTVVRVGNYSPSGHNAATIVDSDGLAPTVMENHGTITAIAIKNNTKQGYLLAEEGDAVDISGRMQWHRGTVQKETSLTITTAGGENVGVVVNNSPKLISGLGEMKSNNGTQFYQQDRIYDGNGIAMCHPAGISGCSYMYAFYENKKCKNCYNCQYFYEDTFCGFNQPMCKKIGSLFNKENFAKNCSDYIYKEPINFNNLRIRKLTPRECFRLMGVLDSDYDKVVKNQSNASLYHLAGDSIVVDVLYHIFKKLL